MKKISFDIKFFKPKFTSFSGLNAWLVCCIFFLYEFFLRTVIGTFQNELIRDLNMTSVEFSIISSTSFFISYGLMQIPAGSLIDNMGLKKSLFIAGALCTISTFGFSISQNFYHALIFRCLMGVGASFGFIGMLTCIYDWIKGSYVIHVISLSQFIGTLGPMVSAGPLQALIVKKNYSWKLIFVNLGFIGLFITILIGLFVKNNQQVLNKFIIIRKKSNFKDILNKLLLKPQPWIIAIISSCVYISLEYFSENEGRNYISLKGIDLKYASYMITTGWLGYAIGCPILGVLSQVYERRRKIIFLSAVLSFMSIVLIIYSSNIYVLFASFFFLGIGASGQSICFMNMAEVSKKEFITLGFGFNNAMITIFITLSSLLMGYLFDHLTYGEIIALGTYNKVFHIIIVFTAVSVVLSYFFLRETYNKSIIDYTYLKKRRY